MGSLGEGTCVGNTSVLSETWIMGGNPMRSTLSIFSMQLLIVTCTTRAIQLLLKPLMMPRISIDIMTSVLLGPSFLGRVAPNVMQALFTPYGETVSSSVGNLGLIFWFFLMGIQLNAESVIKKIDKQSVVLSSAAIVCTYTLAYGTTSAVNLVVPESMRCDTNPLFVGTLIGPPCTAVLASLVVQHKVLHLRFARVAMATATFSHIMLAVLTNFLLAVAPVPGHPLVPLYRVIIGVAFTVLMYALSRLILRPIRNNPKDIYIWLILVATAFVSLMTDMLGLQITSGAFLCGFVMPNGLLAATFIKKMEDITVLFVPLVLVKLGQAVDFEIVFENFHDWSLVIILLLTYAGKQVVVALISRCYNLPLRDGFMVGALLSTKGIVDTLMLGWEATARTGEKLDGQSFTVMLCGIMMFNWVISLTIQLLHNPTSPPAAAHTNCCAVQHLRSDSPFRILACLHDHQMVPTLISLLEATQATAKSPIKLSALRLLRTTNRYTTMIHGASLCAADKAELDPVHMAFGSHQWISENVIVEHYMRISPYSTMHEDVNNLAIENSAALIIIPFHKQLSEAAESSIQNFRSVNHNILANAPCSVGILANRGLMRTSTNAFRNVAVLFFGGPDDREALAYAIRMAKQGVRLTVVRFLPRSQAMKHKESMIESTPMKLTDDNNFPFVMDNDRDKVVDDYCIGLFQMEMAGKKTVSYTEKLVSGGPETVATLQAMDPTHDLFIVGRHQETGESAMTSGMEDWNEYPELGVIGDFLASSDFAAESVLVMQQYVWRRNTYDRESRSLKAGEKTSKSDSETFTIEISSSKAKPSHKQAIDVKDLEWRWNLRAAL